MPSIFLLDILLQVKLALEMKDLGVVGIDLSGNPTVGDWCFFTLKKSSYYSTVIFHLYSYTSLTIFFCSRMTFLPPLKFAREQGLSITLHCGEVGLELQELLPTSKYVLTY